MIFPVTAGMERFPVSNIVISYDENIRGLKAVGASSQEMAEDATRKMWQIVEPGQKESRDRRKADPSFHPKNIPPQDHPGIISAQRSFLYTSCGTMHSLVSLMFANAGVEGMSLLQCKLQYPNGNLENHVNTVLPPEKLLEFPHGALLAIDRQGKPNWSALESGDFERFKSCEERPVFETGENGDFLREVRTPEIEI
jgi:hypothetical protein